LESEEGLGFWVVVHLELLEEHEKSFPLVFGSSFDDPWKLIRISRRLWRLNWPFFSKQSLPLALEAGLVAELLGHTLVVFPMPQLGRAGS
jgi:hypothetical protein